MPDDKTNLTSVPRVQTDLPQVGIWIFNDGARILELLFRCDGCMRRCAVALISARSSNACAAAVRYGAHQRKELERLCRYITRPAIANERLKRTRAGQVVLQLKSPWCDGTTHIVMSPLELMQRWPPWFRVPGCI